MLMEPMSGSSFVAIAFWLAGSIALIISHRQHAVRHSSGPVSDKDCFERTPEFASPCVQSLSACVWRDGERQNVVESESARIQASLSLTSWVPDEKQKMDILRFCFYKGRGWWREEEEG